MTPMATAILTIFDQAPEGEIHSAGDLLHLGPRAGVARCLSHLCKNGELLRIDRGLYVRRIATRFGLRGPSIPYLIDAVARRTGETIVSEGGKCANRLGLTLHVPMRSIFLTSGVTRVLAINRAQVELRHTRCWTLALGGGILGDAARAVQWCGSSDLPETLKRLRRTLTPDDWRAFCERRAQFPDWMATAVEQYLATDFPSSRPGAA
jgi:hypothetical protein